MNRICLSNNELGVLTMTNHKHKIDKVKSRLQDGEILTVRDIFKMGINRPTDTIYTLRKQGINIISTPRTNPKTGVKYVEYSLV